MKKKTPLYVAIVAVVLMTAAPDVSIRRARPSLAGFVPAAAMAAFDPLPIAARRSADFAAMEKFRPGYPFWRNIFTIPDGSVVFGSATDGRALVVFPAAGDWTRNGRWLDRSLAGLLAGHQLPRSLDDKREYVARLLEPIAGPVLHNETRGTFAAPGIKEYGPFFAEWGAIYERFGVPAEIGLAQAMLESGFQGRRRSEANAIGLCQWLERNWDHLNRIDPAELEAGNQTTQAAYCAAYLSVLGTKYGSFIPALSAHHAGGTNVGRILVSGERLGGGSPRDQYLLGSDLARDLRTISPAYGDIYQSYGPRSYRYAEIVFGNTFAIEDVVKDTPQTAIHAMRTTRSISLAEIARRTGLSDDEIRRYNAALVKTVPAGATLYLPAHDDFFGRDVAFWRRTADAEYLAVLDDFVRLNVAPEEWDQPSFQSRLRKFERRFRETGTEEGTVMATVLAYARAEASSARRQILAEFEASEDILQLFERGVHERVAAHAVAAE